MYGLLYGTIAIPLLLLRVISLVFWEQNDELQETFGRLKYSAGAVLSRTLDFDYRHGDDLYEYPNTVHCPGETSRFSYHHHNHGSHTPFCDFV